MSSTGGPDDDPDGPPPEPGPRAVRPIRPGPLVLAGCAAAVLGWLVRPLSESLDRPVPLVGWSAVVVVWVIALAVAVLVFRTWAVLQRAAARGERHQQAGLEPYQAVNRMVLGKAAAVVGSILLGGYVGYALSQVGVPVTPLTDDRIVRAVVAAVGSVVLAVAGLLLERACRVRRDDR